jgi:hypothetical protein
MVLIICKILVLIPRLFTVEDFEMLFGSEGSPSAEIGTKEPHRFPVTLNHTVFQRPPFLEITSNSGERCYSMGSF